MSMRHCATQEDLVCWDEGGRGSIKAVYVEAFRLELQRVLLALRLDPRSFAAIKPSVHAVGLLAGDRMSTVLDRRGGSDAEMLGDVAA
jgi:hypothetical protein